MSESATEERVALVTGSASGIGREAALRLAADGFTVLVHGRDAQRGEAVAKEIVALPPSPAGAAPRAGTATAPARRIAGRPALYLLASLIVSLLAASSAPTPLYATYAQAWGFTPVTTTIVFGAYAVAVLASLLTLGRLSDYLGRRPVLLGALAVHVAALAMFATAGGDCRAAGRPGHPGAVHRRGARRHRRGHARRRPGARGARQRAVARPRHRHRRAGLGAARPLPAGARPTWCTSC